MTDTNFLQESSDDNQTEKLSWTDRARRMVNYYSEASRFIRRASRSFPVTPEHTLLLLQLWIEADDLDGVALPVLSELNSELLRGKGKLDTTRGVSTRQSATSVFDELGIDEVVFEFAWSLSWAEGGGVSVMFTCNTQGIRDVHARGGVSSCERRVGYPVTKRSLEEALTIVYVAEATSLRRGKA